MIVLPDHELVILTPPKTGSSSAHAALCNAKFGGIYVEGPLPGQPVAIECHSFVVPRRYCNYRLAVLTRNPYARAKSLYAHARHYDRERRGLAGFVRDRLIARRHSWWHWPLSIYVGLAKRFSGRRSVESVRLEFVLDDLRRLGIVIDEFPREHVLEDSTSDVASDVADLVNVWASDDFRLGGYSTVGAIPRHSLPDPPVPNWSLHA